MNVTHTHLFSFFFNKFYSYTYIRFLKLGLSKSILIKAIEYALTSFFLYQANKSLVILYKPNADFAFYPLNRASIDSSTSNALKLSFYKAKFYTYLKQMAV